VPPGYRFAGAPLPLESSVVTGFGRGSRQLGVPTANMDPRPLAEQLQQLPRGVYFGWAQLDPPPGWPADDARVHKMVMNVGQRPTVNTGDLCVGGCAACVWSPQPCIVMLRACTGDEAPTVEVYILHTYSQEEFYGCRLRVVAAGFVRPEIRFAGLQQLLGRIRTDIGIAKAQLDEPQAAALRLHESFGTR
jgi:riboflavin kinase